MKPTNTQHLKDFGIINMPRFLSEGRLYDPIIAPIFFGGMLNPDNYVQVEPKAKSRFFGNATSTQAYNRYSCVSNNPLKYTDPSGWLKNKQERMWRRWNRRTSFNINSNEVQASATTIDTGNEYDFGGVGGYFSGSWGYSDPNHNYGYGGISPAQNTTPPPTSKLLNGVGKAMSAGGIFQTLPKEWTKQELGISSLDNSQEQVKKILAKLKISDWSKGNQFNFIDKKLG